MNDRFGHMFLAFANIYKDLAEAIRAGDGLRSMAAVFAVAEPGKANGKWVDARPPMMR